MLGNLKYRLLWKLQMRINRLGGVGVHLPETDSRPAGRVGAWVGWAAWTGRKDSSLWSTLGRSSGLFHDGSSPPDAPAGRVVCIKLCWEWRNRLLCKIYRLSCSIWGLVAKRFYLSNNVFISHGDGIWLFRDHPPSTAPGCAQNLSGAKVTHLREAEF